MKLIIMWKNNSTLTLIENKTKDSQREITLMYLSPLLPVATLQKKEFALRERGISFPSEERISALGSKHYVLKRSPPICENGHYRMEVVPYT